MERWYAMLLVDDEFIEEDDNGSDAGHAMQT